jgi:hypothetical protein
MPVEGVDARISAAQCSLAEVAEIEEIQRSSGVSPVRFAILANIFGPISSSSWNAKTKSSEFGRLSVRCEPDCRFTRQPILSNALRTRRAFEDGQLLKRRGR